MPILIQNTPQLREKYFKPFTPTRKGGIHGLLCRITCIVHIDVCGIVIDVCTGCCTISIATIFIDV